MKLNPGISEIKALSYSVVLVWKKQLDNLPPLSPEFCKSIFGDNMPTEFNLGRDGITVKQYVEIKSNIVIQQYLPQTFHVGFERMVITHPMKDKLLEIYAKVWTEIKRLSFDYTLIIGQMGLNLEYEVISNSVNGQGEINKRFKAPTNTTLFLAAAIPEISLSLLESLEENKVINVVVQPRNNNEMALFMKVNDHYGKVTNQNFIPYAGIVKYLQESESKFSEKILPYLELFKN